MFREEKNLRQRLREMEIGDTLAVKREDYIPSVVKSSAYHAGSDFNMKFKVHTREYGAEVERIS